MSEDSRNHSRSNNRPNRPAGGEQRGSNGQFRRQEGRYHDDRRPRPHRQTEDRDYRTTAQTRDENHKDSNNARNHHSNGEKNTTNAGQQAAQDLRLTAEEAIKIASSLRDKLVELKQNTLKTAIAVTKEHLAKGKEGDENGKGKTLHLNIGTSAFRLLEGVAKKKGYESVQEFALHEVLKTVRTGIEKRLKR